MVEVVQQYECPNPNCYHVCEQNEPYLPKIDTADLHDLLSKNPGLKKQDLRSHFPDYEDRAINNLIRRAVRQNLIKGVGPKKDLKWYALDIKEED